MARESQTHGVATSNGVGFSSPCVGSWFRKEGTGSVSLGPCYRPGRGSPWGVLLARKGVALVADLVDLVMQNKDAMVAAGWGVMVVLVGRHVGCNPVLH